MPTQTFKAGEKDEQKFELKFSKLSPSKSLKVLIYMSKLVGGAAGKAISTLDTKKLSELSEKEIDIGKIIEAALGSLERLEDEEFIDKLNLLFSSVEHSGNDLYVDYLMFDGRPDLIFKVARKAMEVNYSRFLPVILNAVRKGQAVVGNLKSGEE